MFQHLPYCKQHMVGWIRSMFHRLKYLYNWSSVDHAVWRGYKTFRGGDVLEEACHWGWLWGLMTSPCFLLHLSFCFLGVNKKCHQSASYFFLSPYVMDFQFLWSHKPK